MVFNYDLALTCNWKRSAR